MRSVRLLILGAVSLFFLVCCSAIAEQTPQSTLSQKEEIVLSGLSGPAFMWSIRGELTSMDELLQKARVFEALPGEGTPIVVMPSGAIKPAQASICVHRGVRSDSPERERTFVPVSAVPKGAVLLGFHALDPRTAYSGEGATLQADVFPRVNIGGEEYFDIVYPYIMLLANAGEQLILTPDAQQYTVKVMHLADLAPYEIGAEALVLDGRFLFESDVCKQEPSVLCRSGVRVKDRAFPMGVVWVTTYHDNRSSLNDQRRWVKKSDLPTALTILGVHTSECEEVTLKCPLYYMQDTATVVNGEEYIILWHYQHPLLLVP